jgi:hypothetical protein
MRFALSLPRTFTLRGMFMLLILTALFVSGFRGFTRLYRYSLSLRAFLEQPAMLQIAEPAAGQIVLSTAKKRPLSLVLYRLSTRQPTASEYERVLIPLPPPQSDWLCYSTVFEARAWNDLEGEHLQINGEEYLPDLSDQRAQVRANPFPNYPRCGTCIPASEQPAAMMTYFPFEVSFDLSRQLNSDEYYWLFATRKDIAEQLPARLVIDD